MPSSNLTCLNCGAPHLPYEREGAMVPICNICEERLIREGLLAAPRQTRVVAPPSGTISDTRFRPLSSLSPSERLPTRTTMPTPATKALSSEKALAPLPQPPLLDGGRVSQLPRELPGVPGAKPQKVAMHNADRKIGFNCPACLAVLVVKQPDVYDWSAAPCPSCQSVIMPPRVVTPGPLHIAMALPPPDQSAMGRPQKTAPVPKLHPTSMAPEPVAEPAPPTRWRSPRKMPKDSVDDEPSIPLSPRSLIKSLLG